jgi:hypothetical protein
MYPKCTQTYTMTPRSNSLYRTGNLQMLFVYARHTSECQHKSDPKYRRCRCPKWIDGYVDGKRIRQSARTRSWEQAEHNARSIGELSDPGQPSRPVAKTIMSAVDDYLTMRKRAISPRRRASNQRPYWTDNFFLGQNTAESRQRGDRTFN